MIKDFDLFCDKYEISDDQKTYINIIRNSEPSRKVSSGPKNVHGFYSSKKMGLTIQFESHTLELSAIYLMEFDDDVYEYYDQPPSFTINYKINDRNHGHKYTPDFFVISKDFIGWEEWKTDKDLSKLVENSPGRYILDEYGNWRCPPAEEYARKHGLSFRIRSSKEIDSNLQNNIRFLEDYLLEENPIVSNVNRDIIINYVKSVPNITLEYLLSIQDAPYQADDIYRLIILGDIYVDLEKFLIINFDKFPLFRNNETAIAVLNTEESRFNNTSENYDNLVNIEVGKSILWNGNLWLVINMGETKISLLDETERTVELPINTFEELIKVGSIKSLDKVTEAEDYEFLNIINSASPEELAKANEKYFKLKQHLDGEIVDVPARTLRDWKKKFLEAELKFGKGYLGLIPSRHKQGNRNRKIPASVIQLMDKYIEEDFENKKQRNKWSVYGSFKNECLAKKYEPPSFRAFCDQIERRDSYEQDRKRKGDKAAYAKEPIYWELELTTPRHGSRPFELAHIDHTELDIQLICSKTKKNLGRPWLTLLTDAFSRRVLAFYLTFDSPSYRSTMMVIRECVKKFTRLPKTFIVDGGKDFQSIYFDKLLATHNLSKKVRPGAKPRFGSVCERMFGTTNTMFINNLMGNTQIMKNVRQVTKDFNPQGLAIWTLEDLYEVMYQWLYEIYDNKPHPALDMSPREAYQTNIRKTGERKQTYIKYDINFEMITLPTTQKGTAKVQSNGVKINNCYYWSYELQNPSVVGKQVPVRFDPFDYSKAYAYVDNYWIKLNADYELDFMGRTLKEIQIATTEIRQRKKVTQESISINTSEIAEFIKSIEAHEILEMQRLRDAALKSTFTVIEGGKSRVNKQDNSKKEKEKQNSRKEKEWQGNSPILKVINSQANSTENDSAKQSEEFSEFEMYEEFF